jgi:hypothetical protein
MQQYLNFTSTVKSNILYYAGIVFWCLKDTFSSDLDTDINAGEIEEEKRFNSTLKDQNPWAGY